MTNYELELGQKLQEALADYTKYDRLVSTYIIENRPGALRKAVEKGEDAAERIKQYRKLLWQLDAKRG